ncbi:MAG: carbon storage regulator [Clostridia bacterium]|jgi:carbon storage regulator|nr:carbon storage regulator [Clostridia bacterium]MCI1999890.1 carbon storage regulator [Clostridia bacterium]MCI2014194.1 carbon storage regulator [Clostridia bacterium]
MLILQRKIGQSIFIGDEIKITIQDISSDKVKISIDAPKDIKIIREELKFAEISNEEALKSSSNAIALLKDIFKK